jgi:hypothetical protein
MYQDNIKEIENLIHVYFDGIFYGNASSLKTCFSINANIFGDINSTEYFKSVQEYIETVKNRQSPKDLGETNKMSIIGIDILNNISVAKLQVPILGYNYYDYLSLFKINDEWKIVNKIFTHINKG